MKTKKVDHIPLTQKFRKLIGHPECRGSWFIWGDSGNGKSTFLMQLAKELAQWYRVAYMSLEEGDRDSMRQLMEENNMAECRKGSFAGWAGFEFDDMVQELQKPRSPRIIIIDSLQYLSITKKQYKELLEQFPKKLFIINSHAEGRKPVGALARDIKFDADVKIWVEGFKASSRSRMSRGKITEDYTIWEEGAQQYWNNI